MPLLAEGAETMVASRYDQDGILAGRTHGFVNFVNGYESVIGTFIWVLGFVNLVNGIVRVTGAFGWVRGFTSVVNGED